MMKSLREMNTDELNKFTNEWTERGAADLKANIPYVKGKSIISGAGIDDPDLKEEALVSWRQGWQQVASVSWREYQWTDDEGVIIGTSYLCITPKGEWAEKWVKEHVLGNSVERFRVVSELSREATETRLF